MDGITYFITRKRGIEVDLGSTKVNILLYANDLVVHYEFEHEPQRHLNGLDDFYTQRGLVVNLGRSKVLFHTFTQVSTKCH